METLFSSVLVLSGLSVVSGAPVIDSPSMAVQYLMNYNYVQQTDMANGVMMEEETIAEGLRLFQKFSNITVTGTFDNATMGKMNEPRCGMPDMTFHMNDARKRRYSANAAWSRNLTYRIDSFTRDFGTPHQIEQIMADAFKRWTDVTPLRVTKVSSNQEADIIIRFVRYDHGDGNPFDGPGRVLAHAYYPEIGDVHFDDSDTFTATDRDYNLLWVAVHEFGHSLGLGHSDVQDAVMYPYYNYQPGVALHPDDIAGIQTLYGRGAGDADRTMAPVTMPPRMKCTGKFDTITRTADGSTYAFVGTMVYKLTDGNIASGFPAKISTVFPGLPNDLDASVFWEDVGLTFIFKDDQYYTLTNTRVHSGYPQPISLWNGLPTNLDAAFVWSGNGKVYFIKGDKYYRYNRRTRMVDDGYPRPLTVWKGLPSHVDSALQWSNRRTYFFSGEQYYRFNDRRFKTSIFYPLSTVRYWVGCHVGSIRAADTGNGSINKSLPSLLLMLFSTFLSTYRFYTNFL